MIVAAEGCVATGTAAEFSWAQSGRDGPATAAVNSPSANSCFILVAPSCQALAHLRHIPQRAGSSNPLRFPFVLACSRYCSRLGRWTVSVGWDKVAPIMVGRRKPVNLQFWTNAEITVDRDRRPTSASVCLSHPTSHPRPRIAKGHLAPRERLEGSVFRHLFDVCRDTCVCV